MKQAGQRRQGARPAFARMLAIASGQGIRDMVTTRIVDDEGASLELDEFTRGLTHDFSGTYAEALRVFTRAQEEPPDGDSLPKAIQLLRRSLVSTDSRELSRIDLAQWPHARDELGDHDHFLERIQPPDEAPWAEETPPPIDPVGYRDAPAATRPQVTLRDAPAIASEPTVEKRPWWKIW